MKEEPEIVKQLRKEEKNNQLDDFRFNKKPDFVKKIQRKMVIKDLEKNFDSMFFFEILDETDVESSEEKKMIKNSKDHDESVFTTKFQEELDNIDTVDYLDKIDKAIIDLIQVNPNISPSNIAKILKLSRTAIHYRIYDLQKQGYINNFYFRYKRK